ncbi:hypothetical protein Ancab_038791 [Ancistrocladus abbreviatus]
MVAAAGNSLSPNLPLQDRVAIVTGSSRGIGKAVALHLASLGAKLVVNYVSNSTLAHEVIHEINSSRPFSTAEKAFEDQVYILIACVGIIDPTFPSIANTTVESFEKTLNVNAKGTFLCIREAANRLKRDGGGRIVTFSIGAPTGLQDAPSAGAYLASTAAIEEMTKILAKELKGTKIIANCVGPSPIATETFLSVSSEEIIEMFRNRSPLLRLGKPKDVAAVVGFLSSDDGEWVNGQVIPVHGGHWP